MLQVERQEQILQLLKQREAMRVGQIAKELYTSEATVRRDLAFMESEGLVKRVYGGVVLEKQNLPLDMRLNEHAAAKKEIAERASKLLYEGCSVFLDASSTAAHLLPYLMQYSDLTVITNSHRAIETLRQSKLNFICTGGRMISTNQAYVGPIAEATLENLCVDLAFFSCQGVSEDGEVTDFSEEETSLRRLLIRRAKKAVFLCDSSKVGKKYLYRLGNLRDFAHVITDEKFPKI
ncbi:MAG: DeoR/GlpR transcriptional regulator [Clostridia bacterium]|nr:DeoR/GlpR transcriptional regulator [Clostridia bacterium]